MDSRLQNIKLAMELDVLFCELWQMLSLEGVCDAIGGAEFWRVLHEWYYCDRPFPLLFIRDRAGASTAIIPGEGSDADGGELHHPDPDPTEMTP